MLLNTAEINKMAAGSGLNGKCVERLMRSVRITIRTPPAEPEIEETVKRFELAFKIDQLEIRGDRPKALAVITSSIREYSKTCPVVVAWIGRGDFNPEKVPSTVSIPMLLHASRTAGRLRAKVLRALNTGG